MNGPDMSDHLLVGFAMAEQRQRLMELAAHERLVRQIERNSPLWKEVVLRLGRALIAVGAWIESRALPAPATLDPCD